MADEKSQNPAPQDNAPAPDWLKKVQGYESHEEKGPAFAKGGTGTASVTGGQAAAVSSQKKEPASTDVEVSKPLVPKTTKEEVTSGLQGDAPLPLWLKKASEKPLVPTASVPASQPVPENIQPISESSAEALSSSTSPASIAPSSSADAFANLITKTQSQNVTEPKDIQPQPSEPATPATSEPAAPAIPEPAPSPKISPPAGIAIAQSSAPIEGLLETSPKEKPVDLQPRPGISANQSLPVTQPPAGVAKEAKAESAVPASSPEIVKKQEEKAEMMKKAKKTIFSLFEKGKKLAGKTGEAIQTGKAAGAPPPPPVPKLTPEEAAKKAATEKATAEERRQLIEAEKIYQEGLTTIRDLIAPSSMEIKYDLIRIEGLYAQTFFVYSYPRYLDTNWLSPIINFDVTMDISQFIYPIDSAAIMAILKKKVAQMESSIRIAQEKGIVRDPALETALEDAEELRTEIQRGQEKFFQFGLYFTIYGEDEKKLIKISKQLESLLGGKLILTKKSELQMEHGFNSTIPLCLDEIEVIRNMNTSPLSSTFPFSSSDLTTNEGILYGLNRHNDSLIIFDRFSLENANSVVFAKSGAGKSYCVKLEILRSLMFGLDVIVIDPENEYEALSQTVGGSYLRVSLTSDRRINPFDLPSALQDEELQPGDLLRSNIINLHGLLKIMLGGVTPVEEGILDKALNDVYAIKGITMDMVDPSQILPPTMEDLYDILSTMDGGQSLAQRLQKYTQGTYSGIFNKLTNIDLSTGLMVFSIRDLEDALRPTAMYIILNYIWNRVRSRLKKRLLVIDEAWTMMQYEDSAKFLFGLVKRARKYYLGITTITQDVEDFVKSPYGKPVVTNSSLQLLLKQAPSAIEILGKTFNLTEGEKYMLLNSGVGQGLFFAGLKHVAIQIIASYSEDKIVTTNPEEILRGRMEAQQYEGSE